MAGDPDIRPSGIARKWFFRFLAVLVALLIVFALLVMGRGFYGRGDAWLVSGPNLYDVDIDQIVRDRTTRSKILQILGEPSCLESQANGEELIFRSVWQQTNQHGLVRFAEYYHTTYVTFTTVTLVDDVVTKVEMRGGVHSGKRPADVPFDCSTLPQ